MNWKNFLAMTMAIFAIATMGTAAAQTPAQEAALRKTVADRLPNLPPIEGVRAAPIPGFYEIIIDGSEVAYVDAKGDYLFQGDIIDLRKRQNLTKARQDELSALSFKSLATKDAITLVFGNGKNKVAVFEDPNCGFCKKIEKELQKLDNTTVYVFVLPILGEDSTRKAKNIWCAKDGGKDSNAARSKAWLDWMLNNVPPPTASCDTSAIDRNLAFARKARITGTPAAILTDGSRIPGMVNAEQLAAAIAKAAAAGAR